MASSITLPSSRAGPGLMAISCPFSVVLVDSACMLELLVELRTVPASSFCSSPSLQICLVVGPRLRVKLRCVVVDVGSACPQFDRYLLSAMMLNVGRLDELAVLALTDSALGSFCP